MIKKIVLVLAVCLALAQACAGLVITEVMYNPNQADDTSAEWIELYNEGEEPVGLGQWYLNGKKLSGTLESDEYIVIARKLVGTNGSDSFESIWGNDNGAWDEDFDALESSFSLPNSLGTINLTDGMETASLSYNSSWGGNGNGKSISRINISLPNTRGNWNETEATPGKGGSTDLGENEAEIDIRIENVLPTIRLTLSPDDLQDNGVQIVANGTRVLMINAYVNDENGADDITNVTAEISGRIISLSKMYSNGTEAMFNGSLVIIPNMTRQKYSLTGIAYDSMGNTTALAEFEIIGMVSSVLETTRLDFGSLLPGKFSEEKLLVLNNKGHSNIDVSFSVLKAASVKVEMLIGSEWKDIRQPVVSLPPGERKEIKVRVKAPNAKAKKFKGRIVVNAKNA